MVLIGVPPPPIRQASPADLLLVTPHQSLVVLLFGKRGTGKCFGFVQDDLGLSAELLHANGANTALFGNLAVVLSWLSG
jgi:hypothetical protein